MHHGHVRQTDWDKSGSSLSLHLSTTSPPLQSVKVGCRRVMEVVQNQQRKQSPWAL